MTNSKNQGKDFNPMDEWDAAFESSDPTRVLDPALFEKEPVADTGRLPQQRVQAGAETAEFEPIVAAGGQRQVSAVRVDEQDAAPALPAADAGYSYEQPRDLVAKYSRLQLLPCFLGWLVSYALLSLGSMVGKQVLAAFDAQYVGVPGHLLGVLQTDIQRGTPWLVVLGVVSFVAYTAAGYTAARLARYAVFKQALGVMLWVVFTGLLASLYTYLLSPAGVPEASFQYLLGSQGGNGILSIIIYLTCCLIFTMVGALFGKRYESVHQKYA